MKDWLTLLIIGCLLFLFFGIGVRIGQAHEPYPTTYKQMDINLKINAQKHAINKQELDRKIELKKLELDLMKQKECTEPSALEMMQVVGFDLIEYYVDDQKTVVAVPSNLRKGVELKQE